MKLSPYRLQTRCTFHQSHFDHNQTHINVRLLNVSRFHYYAPLDLECNLHKIPSSFICSMSIDSFNNTLICSIHYYPIISDKCSAASSKDALCSSSKASQRSLDQISKWLATPIIKHSFSRPARAIKEDGIKIRP